MDLFPKLTGYVQGFFTWKNWPYLLATAMVVLGVLILVALIIYFIRKRRNADGEKEQAKPKEKPKGLPASSLVKIWKEFLREIPRSVRPNVIAYEHFIVFGEAGTGKSALIDNYTDWQGHARQFYPSYTADPLLQIYLGSNVLVQEIPASLLIDTSEFARRALMRLWKSLFRHKDPTVVIVLNGVDLQSDEPEYLEYLKQKAQIIRGKINLLGHIRKKPVKVRIALTYMDQIGGFFEFSQFLAQNNIPLELTFPSQGDATDISDCLEPYEEHLTRALISLPADKYLKAITFMRHAPKLFQDLSVFIKFLRNPDPLSLEPEVTQIYLTSQAEGETPVLNPFAPTITAQEIQKIDPYFKHRVTAAAVCVAGLFYLGTAYLHERSLVAERLRTLASLEASPPAMYDQRMHDILPFAYLQQHPWMKLLPDFFPGQDREITRRCTENIRRLYLLPALESISSEMRTKAHTAASQIVTINSPGQQYRGKIEDVQDRAIYLLALIYATRDNELGTLIRNNATSWSQILNISTLLINDYVKNNDSSSHIVLDTSRLSFNRTKSSIDDPRSWMVYFTEIGRLSQQPVLAKPEFEKVLKETDRFTAEIQQLDFYDFVVKIVELLKREAPEELNLNGIGRKESEIRQEPVKDLLKFIKNSDLSYPGVADSSGFTGLLENLKVMSNDKGAQGEKEFRFIFGGEEFRFNTRQWNELLNRSRISLYLRDFINSHRSQDGFLFFPSDKEFDDLVMNSSNDGRFLFIGHARVDGRFTKDAVEKRVKPMLTELPAVVDNLPIPQKEKTAFSNFLFKEVDIYGKHYAQHYRKYYMEFDIKAGSVGALRFVLSQMTLPASPLRDVLMTMKNNTQIDPGKNEYLQSFALNLSEFDFIRRLTGEQKGTYPELDKYKGLLEQMQMDIQDQPAPAGKKDKDDPFVQFKNRLTPLGRISFAIFNNDKDSYLNLVKLWLDSVGVPRPWQDIFLAPVWQAYFLGITEVESEMGKIWTELWQADIQPLYSKFPFEPSSGEDASADMLKNATHPAGHFWSTYRGMLAPFCSEEGQVWRKKNGPLKAPKIPDKMLPTVNAIARISSTLWDKEGKERPLELMVKPALLPTPLPGEAIAVLSYLHVGDSTIFALNQKPSWKRIRLHWQSPSWATVGVEFTTKDQSLKVKKTIEIPNSSWSFYHLLQKAKETVVTSQTSVSAKRPKSARNLSGTGNGQKGLETLSVKWQIQSPATTAAASRPMDIIFYIQTDPWTVFNLPH